MTLALVTGGAGFIGSHIVDELLAKNLEVRVIDNLSTGNRDHLAHVEGEIEFVEGDINDSQTMAKVVQNADLVFHQAALASVPLSLEKPLVVHQACATGTLAVLEHAKNAGVQRVIYAASSSCYGDQPFSAKRESDRLNPLSPYAAAKIAGEMYCQAYYHSFGLKTVGIRYFNVFGPRQDPNSPYSAVIPLFITRMLAGEQPTIFGDGYQSRDFTFVQNVVAGNMAAATAENVGGQVFNIADGRSTDLLTLIECLNKLLGTAIEPAHHPPRSGDVRESLADISKAVDELGYQPQVRFEEGLEQSVDYYRSIIDR